LVGVNLHQNRNPHEITIVLYSSPAAEMTTTTTRLGPTQPSSTWKPATAPHYWCLLFAGGYVDVIVAALLLLAQKNTIQVPNFIRLW
jgi:hypothetical protein